MSRQTILSDRAVKGLTQINWRYSRDGVPQL